MELNDTEEMNKNDSNLEPSGINQLKSHQRHDSLEEEKTSVSLTNRNLTESPTGSKVQTQLQFSTSLPNMLAREDTWKENDKHQWQTIEEKFNSSHSDQDEIIRKADRLKRKMDKELLCTQKEEKRGKVNTESIKQDYKSNSILHEFHGEEFVVTNTKDSTMTSQYDSKGTTPLELSASNNEEKRMVSKCLIML